MNNKASYNNTDTSTRRQQLNHFPRELQDIRRQMLSRTTTIVHQHHPHHRHMIARAIGIDSGLRRDRLERPSNMDFINAALRVAQGDEDFLLLQETRTNASEESKNGDQNRKQ